MGDSLLEKSFEIGQVVYILSEQAQTILPGLVAEELVVKKITGNSVSWKIKVGSGDKAKLFDSAKIKGEIYGSLEEVRTVMTKRLNEYIDKISTEAQQRVENWYGKEIADRQKMMQASPSAVGSGIDDRIDPELLLNAIENVPVQQTIPKFKPETSPKTNLRERLTDMVVDKSMEPGQVEDVGEGGMFVQGPNGERIRIHMK